MTFVWLTLVISVFNICLGFALGTYVQGLRRATGEPAVPDPKLAFAALPEENVDPSGFDLESIREMKEQFDRWSQEPSKAMSASASAG